MKTSVFISLCLFAIFAHATDGDLPTSAGTPITAADDDALTAALNNSAPGQHILLTGPSYSKSRTLNSGKVLVNTNLSSMPVISGVYSLSGTDSVVYGLEFFQSGRAIVSGDRAKVIRCEFHGQTESPPIVITDGADVVIARNELYEWGTTGECGARRGISLRAPLPNGTDGARRPRISYNYLHDQIGYNSETCTIDAEAISLGQTGSSGRSESHLEAWVHHNLIVNCRGDSEGFGVKSSYNLIEFNHLDGVLGFNNRLGAFNDFIGNRIRGSSSSGRYNRGGYHNRSIGEVFENCAVSVDPGTYSWGDAGGNGYLRADNTVIIGSTATDFRIGYDFSSDNRPLHAINTLIQATNTAPSLGPKQTNTTNNYSSSEGSISVPAAIHLSAVNVGPRSGLTSGTNLSVSPSGMTNFGYRLTGTSTDVSFTVTNTGNAVATGNISVDAPFVIVSGSPYTIEQGTTATVTVRYLPTSPGQHTSSVTFSDTDVTFHSVTGVAVTPQTSLSFNVNAGSILAPMADHGAYIAQPEYTPDPADGGLAVYALTIPTAGIYKVQAVVNASTTGSDSFFVNFDAEPAAQDTWDVLPLTSGFELRDVSQRGSGTFDSPQFAPATWSLSAGIHFLIIRGRERDAQLQSIAIVPVVETELTVPSTPSELVIEML